MHLELDLPDARLTAADFQALPEVEGFRLELWEGNLVVMAAAQMAWHSATARRVEDLFRATGREVVREVGVVVASRDVPVPDVVVFHVPIGDLRRSQFPAADVACVVEVISPESRERDTRVKPDKYAAAGIPELWLVAEDPEAPLEALVSIYRLTPAGSYGLAEKQPLSALEARDR